MLLAPPAAGREGAVASIPLSHRVKWTEPSTKETDTRTVPFQIEDNLLALGVEFVFGRAAGASRDGFALCWWMSLSVFSGVDRF